MAGLCQYESIALDRLDLADLDMLNELIDVQEENNRRVHDSIGNGLDRSERVIPPTSR